MSASVFTGEHWGWHSPAACESHKTPATTNTSLTQPTPVILSRAASEGSNQRESLQTLSASINAERVDIISPLPLSGCSRLPQNGSFAIRCADAQDDRICRPCVQSLCDGVRWCRQTVGMTSSRGLRIAPNACNYKHFFNPTPACHPEPRSERRIQSARRPTDNRRVHERTTG